jgi:hypothetical protein
VKTLGPRKLWVLAGVLLAGHFFIQYAFIKAVDLSDQIDRLDLAVDVLSQLVLVVVLGSALGAITALIPFKRAPLRQKFNYTFPIGCSLILAILIATYGMIAYYEKVNGVKIQPLITYGSVQVDPHLDCSTVHDGEFEIGSVVVTRKGSLQRQQNKHTGVVEEFKVEWLSDCEYILTPLADPEHVMKVKIVHVSEEGYNCYAASGKYATAHSATRLVR